MLEITRDKDNIIISNSSKNSIIFNTENNNVSIDDLTVVHPWEFEKSGILLEVKIYNDILFYSFMIDQKHLIIVSNDTFELKEEILSFFWDVDILIIKWSKEAINIYENIEARLVVPFGDGKNLFLTSLWQHNESVKSYKLKADFALDATEFVNLD